MDEINPFERAPLYEEEQVLTPKDLVMFSHLYKEKELQLAQMGYLQEAVECCHLHQIFERLIEWIKDGKPEEAFGNEQD